MTSPLSSSSKLCFKLLKRLLHSCQCLLTHVCLLCMSKVCRWNFFSLLAWFPLTIHLSLSVSEVSYKPLHLMYDFSFSFFFNFFTHNFCMCNLSWLNMLTLTLVQQAQQQQHQQQQQQCKCCTDICLRADSSQSPHSLQCVHCCSYSCGCWWRFSSLCWSTAAHSVCSLFSDKRHLCAAWCECLICMTSYHVELGEDSSVIVH